MDKQKNNFSKLGERHRLLTIPSAIVSLLALNTVSWAADQLSPALYESVTSANTNVTTATPAPTGNEDKPAADTDSTSSNNNEFTNEDAAGHKLKAIHLEATVTRSITLKEALTKALENNLSIGISRANVDFRKWNWLSSLGKFLPDLLINYHEQMCANDIHLGGPVPASYHTPNHATSGMIRYYAFQGGRALYQAKSDLHEKQASEADVHAILADVILEITKRYYAAVLSQASHQIHQQAIDAARAQVNLNTRREQEGQGTKYNILQSRVQLARDQQALLGEDVSLRESTMKLAVALGIDPGVNFIPVECEIKKIALVDPSLTVGQLLALAMKNRPELKRAEFARLAARERIRVAADPIFPALQLYASLNSISPYLSNVLGPLGTLPGTIYLPNQRLTQRVGNAYSFGFEVNWNFVNLGMSDLARAQAERANARIALMRAEQQAMSVIAGVRQAYLNSLSAEQQIEVATQEYTLAREQLRLSKLRVENGLGSNLELLQAQRDLTAASLDKAKSIIKYNVAQAELLHETGLISVDSLTKQEIEIHTNTASTGQTM